MAKFIGIIQVILFFFILLNLGCTTRSDNDRHVEYFDPIFKKFDTISYNKVDQAFAYLDSAFYSFQQPSAGDIFSYDSIKCARLMFSKNDYLKAESYTDSMIAISEGRMNDELFIERYYYALFRKGDCLRLMRKFDESLQYYKLGQQVGLKYIDDICKRILYNGSVANLMFVQQKYLLAAQYFLKECNDYHSSCHADNYRQMIDLEAAFNNVALSYMRAGILDSAWYYQKKALAVIEKDEKKYPEKYANTNYVKSVIYGDQAEVLFRQQKYDEAEPLYKKSIAGTIVSDRPFAQSTQARLAELYLHRGDNENLERTLNDLKQSLDMLSEEAQFMSWLSLKKKYFKQIKKIDSAFFYQEKFDDQRDSIEKRNKEFESHDVGDAFENSELRYYNESLQKSDKLKSLYLAISLLVFIMAASIAVLVWYNLKGARKLNMQVQQKNIALEEAFSSLEQSHLENTRIMRVVAHDLKNPISAIQNIMHGLLQKERPEREQEMFEAIHSSCVNSLSLIRDLLEERKEQLKKAKRKIDMSALLENCVQLLQAKANEKRQRLNLVSEFVEVMIDDQKIWRVMSNIINNAIKFSPMHTTIYIRLYKKGNSILFSVKDNGIGIPENIKNKIFEMAAEVRRLGTEGERSHGLGLSISKKIVEDHHGKLWFDSKVGEGTIFYVELPINE